MFLTAIIRMIYDKEASISTPFCFLSHLSLCRTYIESSLYETQCRSPFDILSQILHCAKKFVKGLGKSNTLCCHINQNKVTQRHTPPRFAQAQVKKQRTQITK